MKFLYALFSPLAQVNRLFFALILIAILLPFAQSQTLRDPTQPPPMVGVDQTASAATGAAAVAGGMAIVVRDGTAYLVQGTRLYAKGQRLGVARIERISETEVWLREAGKLTKIPVFSGVQRRAVVPVSVASRVKNKPNNPRPTLSKP